MDDKQLNAVEAFKKVATEFCALVDSASESPRTLLLSKIYIILPELIMRGAALPAVSDEDDEAPSSAPKARMPDEEWRRLYELLREKLKPTVMYRHVVDAWKDCECIEGSLADDIADIYRDLKNGSEASDAGDMVFDWRLNFYFHWGHHATAALKALHHIMEELNDT